MRHLARARALSRLAGTVCLSFSGAALVAVALHDFAGLGRGGLTGVRDALYLALIFSVACVVAVRAASSRSHRKAWLFLATGVLCWLLGFFVYLEIASLPRWSVDLAWFASYPLFYAAIGLLILGRLGRPERPLLLDGISGAAAAAAVVAALLAPVQALGKSEDLMLDAAALGYPIVDALLLAFVVGLLAITGGRTARGWVLLTLSVAVLLVTDAIYASSATKGEYVPRGGVDVLWALTLVLMGAAAWMRDGASIVRTSTAPIVIPVAASLVGLAVLFVGATAGADPLAVALAMIALLTALARTVLTLRELRLLASAREQSVTDDLTGLGNRRYLADQLSRGVEGVSGERMLALLMIDLDGFKELNDSLGHDAGDAVLQRVGQRLQAAAGPELTVARLGGDEFAVVAPHVTEPEAKKLADHLRERIARPVRVQGIHVYVGASVGIALAPLHGTTPTELMRRADAAMYEAKRAHVGVAAANGSDDHEAFDRLRLAGDLPTALAQDAIVLHYQPQVSTSQRRVVAVEALARWQHPERGLLGPGDFLPALELTDLGPAFTRRVIEQAVVQAAAWRRSGLHIPVAVNLTALDMRDSSLPEQIELILARHAALPSDLTLEITERGLLTDPERTSRIFKKLRAMGIRVALDDFGTGFSSMTHLHRIEVDSLKIDRSFVSRIEDDPAAAAIVEGTVRLAHLLGLEVVGEGVETEIMWAKLRALGCDLAQGFLLGKPLPAVEVEEHIRSLNRSRGMLSAALAVG